MARSRNIKPGFFTNDRLAELPPLTRILFAGLWTIADRDGRVEDRPKRIKALCLPFDDVDIDTALSQLAQGKDPFIIRYEVDGVKYLQITSWRRHQSPHVNEPESCIPPVPEQYNTSTIQVPEHSVCSGYRESGIRNQESTIRNQESEGKKPQKRFTPPTLPEVTAYCTERKNSVDPAAFIDFYTSKGWRVGSQPMRDWQSAVRNWERQSRNRGSPVAASGRVTTRNGTEIISDRELFDEP